MEKKFTKGEWRYTDEDGLISIHYGDTPQTEGEDGKEVDQSICGIWVHRHAARYRESIANAKLIAAAPDLLEALEKANKLITSMLAEVYRKEIQQYLAGGFKDTVEDAVLKDSLGIEAALRKALD